MSGIFKQSQGMLRSGRFARSRPRWRPLAEALENRVLLAGNPSFAQA